jgi:DNA-binding NarL/FixJ family response regulator
VPTSASILLIDDHALFRSGLQMVLSTGLPGVEVAGVGSLEEAMRSAAEAPAVVLLDIQLQGLNGLEGIALVKRKWPQAAVVMLSSHTGQEWVRASLSRGAAAFVSKADTAENILAVVSPLLRGEGLPPAPAEPAPTGVPRLTPRQSEVLDLLCQGLSNKAIGKRLNLSENTVRGHVQATFAFLHVSSRSEAAFAARRQGLVA